ncbi:MAG: squalene/phytoene synthase family protein [Rhodospirillales bacterium]|nr:squalene/phytoene synthase family protein [Rhodospirillales bacterium]
MNKGKPQGRTETDENFPVVFNLLPKHKKPHVLAFYKYARAADDIADSDTLTEDQKLHLLNEMEATVLGKAPACANTETAAKFRNSLAITKVPTDHAIDLLTAFRWDASSKQYETWEELMEYCRYSAQPVGRYLLDLQGETSTAARDASDALSSALQIINHIQDCRDDLKLINRIYVPANWLEELSIAPGTLLTESAIGPMRDLLDRMLDGVDKLLSQAKVLPHLISNRGLRAQAAVTLACGERLAHKLRIHDPLTTRVELSKLEKLELAMVGGVRGLFS